MFKNSIFYFLIAASVIAIVFVYLPGFAAADNSSCDFQPQLDQLKNIQGNPLPDYRENIKAELSVRKRLLGSIIDCSVAETQQQQSSLNALPDNGGNVKNIAQKISSELNDVVNYYEFQKTRVDGMGIQGSKNLAQEIEDWRQSNYWPLRQEANNFIIWAHNQDLINAAQTRLKEIESTVKGLKLDEQQNISDNLQGAEDNLKQAVSQNLLAEGAFENFSLPDNTLSYIKSSLDYLAKTYQNFFEISQSILKQ